MPGVTVSPNSPGLPGFGSPLLGKTMSSLPHDKHQTISASATQSRPNVANNTFDPVKIKEQAITFVRKEAQGSSGPSMLAVAHKQYIAGKDYENQGDLGEAYRSFVMAATLVKSAMDQQSEQTRSHLYSRMDESLKTDLGDRTKSVEEKLKKTLQQNQLSRPAPVGGSIADRKKALEGNGLSLGDDATSKRISRTLSEMPSPTSPKEPSMRISTPVTLHASLPSVPASLPPSPRTPIPPSSFPPASPSPPTSPIATFTQSFPSLEEIEANVPSIPSPVDATPKPPPKPLLNGIPQIERSPSTPNFPVQNLPPGSAMQPSLQKKLSNLSILSSSTLAQPPYSKPLIPVSGTATPEELLDYLDRHNVLLLDVRTRPEFEAGHVKYKNAAIACVEPSMLRDDHLSLATLEKSMSKVPSGEKSVFANREKFELVVLYDDHSKSLGASNTPLSILNRLISSARVPQKTLKRQPMLLVGGLNAWKRYYDSSEVPTTISSEVPSSPPTTVTPATTTPSSPSVSRANSNNPFNAFVPPTSPNPLPAKLVNSNPFHRPMSVDYNFGHLSNLPSGQFSYPALGIPIPPSPQSIASLPPASIKPSQLSRKRTDYDDPSQEAVTDLRMRTQIAYPALSNPPILQPPPPAASSALERQDTRPRVPTVPAPPTGLRNASTSDFQVHYWAESISPVCGLHNLGNTCFMNATLQCLYATPPFLSFFKDHPWERSINMLNPLGTQGKVTKYFESLLKDMWARKESSIRDRLQACLAVIRQYDPQYIGTNQHDSQEFLTFLLDKIHEDLNRILTRPPQPRLTAEQELALERRDPRRAIDEEWANWRSSNDSIIVDLFQGQFKNRLQCTTCGRTKRNATKRLSLARLPPILVIHLKRFQTSGSSAGKLDTFVHCPTKYLEFHASPDMPDEPRGGPSGDPRTQVAPYKYELYAVTNHRGQLNSGHYTAHVQTSGDWYSISDTNISRLTSQVVVSK
ncbi:hypothetical protein H0H92_005840 [Tricholoma furcatifolium]|nr:hypothetical protein H0H92_005840 [Tricholoma furcatifolium]